MIMDAQGTCATDIPAGWSITNILTLAVVKVLDVMMIAHAIIMRNVVQIVVVVL